MTTPTPTPASDLGYAPPSNKRALWKWYLAATAVVLVFLMWQCGSALYKAKGPSNTAAQEFHQKLNAGQYEEILAEADERFARAEKHDDLVGFLEAIHTKLGNAGVEKLTNIKVNATTAGTFIVAQYKTAFDDGSAIETFTWIKSSGVLKLCGYHIQSNALIMK